MQKNGNRLFKFAFCIVLTVWGIFTTFFSDRLVTKDNLTIGGSEVVDMQEMNENGEYKMFEQAQDLDNLPDVENISSDENYSVGIDSSIYFSNMEIVDQGNLPLEVHAVLVDSAQKYLNRSGYSDVTELYVDEESYIETEEQIAFECFMDGYSTRLRISFVIGENCLKFSLVE